MTDTGHACGNPHCKRRAKIGQLACRVCWFVLPQMLRDAIVSTWREKQIEAYRENVAEARKLWGEASDEAHNV